VLVGQWVGDSALPQLLAVDTRQAGTLLRGRLPDGTTWAKVGAALRPRDAVSAVALPPSGTGQSLTLTGNTTPGPQLRVLPRLVLEDRYGLRTPCEAAAVSLDGRPHPLKLCAPLTGGQRLVALTLQIDLDPAGPEGAVSSGDSQLTVDLNVPASGAATATDATTWTAAPMGDASDQVTRTSTDLTSTSAGTVIRTTAGIILDALPYQSIALVATAFAPPTAIPVAVSRQFVGALGISVGKRLTVTVGTAALPVVVTEVVPTIPSVPGGVALLADGDTLSRALIATGDLAPAVDAWWVGHPTQPAADARAANLSLGNVVTRENTRRQLTGGPLRIGLPAALAVLVPAALLLALAGTLMHVTSDVEARALEMARLRGLGLSRRNVLRGLLVQHGGLLALLVVAGAVVGAVVSWAVGPLLIRSDVGAAPVPAALARWPWPAEGSLIAVLLLGGTAAVALVIAVQLRRADHAHLRAGT
jgi:hypothetical protein